MLVAALRRLAFVLVLALGVTVVLSLALGLLIGASVNRALTLGFYLGGSFLLIVGFFVGNRGPARVKGEDTIGPTMLPIPGAGSRRLRWATLGEQNETINNSALFISLGLILVALGAAIDTRHSLF
ncbi:MAG: hypothetical protein E6G31_06580 [Actinobacteria bacterium]|nr:MAG: hypothetical protein E6G31_06580 [Actinomycetota bacterium]